MAGNNEGRLHEQEHQMNGLVIKLTKTQIVLVLEQICRPKRTRQIVIMAR